jgi:MtN3 and saliva related transmembrane protein
MIDANAIGLISGALTTLAFVPQVWKVWQTRSARDISMGMYAVFTAGVIGWLVYGCLLGAWPIIIANALTALLAGSVIAMKWFFARPPKNT